MNWRGAGLFGVGEGKFLIGGLFNEEWGVGLGRLSGVGRTTDVALPLNWCEGGWLVERFSLLYVFPRRPPLLGVFDVPKGMLVQCLAIGQA